MDQTRNALHRARSFLPGAGTRCRFGPLLAALLALGAAFAAGGCAYRIDIQQGNIIDPEDLEQVREGMTRSQVQFLLGTPMIADTFHADRWDYTYYYQQGRRRELARYWVSVFFEEDRVVRIEEHIPVRRASPVPLEDLADELAGDLDEESLTRLD